MQPHPAREWRTHSNICLFSYNVMINTKYIAIVEIQQKYVVIPRFHKQITVKGRIKSCFHSLNLYFRFSLKRLLWRSNFLLCVLRELLIYSCSYVSSPSCTCIHDCHLLYQLALWTPVLEQNCKILALLLFRFFFMLGRRVCLRKCNSVRAEQEFKFCWDQNEIRE